MQDATERLNHQTESIKLGQRASREDHRVLIAILNSPMKREMYPKHKTVTGENKLFLTQC